MSPLYDYQCPRCSLKIEYNLKISELDKKILCTCSTPMNRLMSSQGATLGDERVWLESTTEMLKGSDAVHKDPVSSMTEYRKLLKEKGLTPIG